MQKTFLQVGAGVLGLPSAMAYLGWTAGTIVMVLACELPQDTHIYSIALP